jgi:hypothetical protein
VRLSPVVAHAVLGACPELGGTVVALDDLWGRDATRTEEQPRAAASWDDRFAIVEATLARRHEAGRAVSPEVAFVWAQLVTGRGQVRVDQLAAEIGWSRKRLWSRFRSQIGLTPSAPPGWSVSTTPPTSSPQATVPPGWRRRPATPPSPTSIGTSWPSPG